MIDMPDNNIPVYKVQKEFGNGSVKTLHRNMLLPFSVIPIISEFNSIPERKRSEKGSKDRAEVVPVPASISESEVDSDSSEEPAVFVPRYIPPHRRNKVSLTSESSSANGSAERSINTINDSANHESLNTFRGSPSLSRNFTSVGTDVSFQTDSTGSSNQPSSIVSSRNLSEQLIQPRRSGRNRQAPQRYGEWILNQITVDNSEEVEYFV